MLIFCIGITHRAAGSDNVLACANLVLLCGQVGTPGAGRIPLRGQNSIHGACDMGALAHIYPGDRRVDDPEVRAIIAQDWGAAPDTLSRSPVLTVVEMMHHCKGSVAALYVMGENPKLSDPNADRVQEALTRFGLLVMNDTLCSTPVVSPMCCEKDTTSHRDSLEARSQVELGGRQVLGPLSNRMMVNPEARKEEAEHKVRPFLLFLLALGDFCAPKGVHNEDLSRDRVVDPVEPRCPEL